MERKGGSITKGSSDINFFSFYFITLILLLLFSIIINPRPHFHVIHPHFII